MPRLRSIRRRAAVTAFAVLAGAGATGTAIWWQLFAAPYRPPTSTASAAARVNGGGERDVQIAVWQRALAADTGSALVLSQLAALHAQRARETGAFDEYLEAEALARHALARRTQRNGAAAATLISVLLAQHRFEDAMGVADALVGREPDIPSYRAARAEVAMELGRYALADSLFASLRLYRTQPAIAPRIGRWLELTGHPTEAAELLRTARRQLAADRDTPRETLAWFSLRLGDLEWRRGRPRAAAAAYREGLAQRPDDPRLLAAMARLSARVQQGRSARVWAERAVAAQADATTLLALAEAQEAAGDSAQARATAEAVRGLVTAQGGPPHREWLLWQLDHHEQVAQVLANAQADLAHRADIYGLDLVGWALRRNGESEAARPFLARAAALGTRDPLLAAHRAGLDRVPAGRRDVDREGADHPSLDHEAPDHE